MVEKILPRAGLKLGTARSVGQCLTHLATGNIWTHSNETHWCLVRTLDFFQPKILEIHFLFFFFFFFYFLLSDTFISHSTPWNLEFYI